ncbi:MAG: DNA-binding protein WhiA [Merdibacter sp.]
MNRSPPIRLIESSCGIQALDEDLRELARLRLENPDLSLRSLDKLCRPRLARSGVNHRLRRILMFAQELGKATGGE